jgi:hypothetical protein
LTQKQTGIVKDTHQQQRVNTARGKENLKEKPKIELNIKVKNLINKDSDKKRQDFFKKQDKNKPKFRLNINLYQIPEMSKHKQKVKEAGRQKDSETERHRDSETDRKRDRETDRKRDRETERQREGE